MARAALATLAVAAAVTWAAAGPVNTRGPQQDDACLACVCRANGRSGECVTGGKCTHVDTFGPFCISLPYWIDAGKPVLPGDDKDLPGAFQRCVEEPFCAVQTVRGYMNTGPALQDCDNDGAVTCRDLMLTHIFGRYACVDRRDARVESLMRCLTQLPPRPPPHHRPARPARARAPGRLGTPCLP
ncbi:Protein of unknown function [Gryllus bimaculatus]|nr:Protein of unknown function [Gryllus bimaculatus]